MLIKNHFYFHWLYKRQKYRHYFNIFSGVFIWLFLWVTIPFGIYNHNLSNYLELGLFLFPFGASYTLISYAVDGLLRKPAARNPEYGLQINFYGWIVKLIGLVHAIYLTRQQLCDWECVDFAEYLEIWLACILLFLITYIPFSLYGRYAYFHSLLGIGQQDSSKQKLIGEGKESLLIDINAIIYIQSSDNYLDIFIANPKMPGEKIVFRCTIKSIEAQLKEYSQFIRIHRSYLVNVRYVVKSSFVSTTNKSLRVAYESFETDLPISKSYKEKVDDLFTHPK